MNDSRLHFENDDELEDFNKRTNFHADYDYVSFILKRADAYGLKEEVEEILASIGMNLIVAIGFYLDFKNNK
mgnify:CR=1 FL=1